MFDFVRVVSGHAQLEIAFPAIGLGLQQESTETVEVLDLAVTEAKNEGPHDGENSFTSAADDVRGTQVLDVNLR